jgi:hypothetical protein
MIMSHSPTRDDKFSFGLWTIGWVGQDQFGSPSRAPLARGTSPTSPPAPRTTTGSGRQRPRI